MQKNYWPLNRQKQPGATPKIAKNIDNFCCPLSLQMSFQTEGRLKKSGLKNQFRQQAKKNDVLKFQNGLKSGRRHASSV